MVRVNLLNPESLTDQHLVTEYNEILLLIDYIRKHPNKVDIPNFYILGKGHVKFFKDKLIYLQRRHTAIKEEMMKRGFDTNKSINIYEFNHELHNDWRPSQTGANIVRERIKEKIILNPNYYEYCGEKKSPKKLIEMTESADIYP